MLLPCSTDTCNKSCNEDVSVSSDHTTIKEMKTKSKVLTKMKLCDSNNCNDKKNYLDDEDQVALRPRNKKGNKDKRKLPQ